MIIMHICIYKFLASTISTRVPWSCGHCWSWSCGCCLCWSHIVSGSLENGVLKKSFGPMWYKGVHVCHMWKMNSTKWLETGVMWICWNLLWKTCEITSSEFIFGHVLAIWNYCAAASEVRSLLILLEAPARRSLVAAAAVRTGGYRGVPRTAPHTPPLCRGAQHHQAISTPPRGCWC